jgi:hypothetical protein
VVVGGGQESREMVGFLSLEYFYRWKLDHPRAVAAGWSVPRVYRVVCKSLFKTTL